MNSLRFRVDDAGTPEVDSRATYVQSVGLETSCNRVQTSGL